MRKTLTFILACMALSMQAQFVYEVNDFITNGPFKPVQPLMTDTVDMNGKKPVPAEGLRMERKFYVNNTRYTKGTLTVKGTAKYDTTLDGTTTGEQILLEPGHHEVTVRYNIAQPEADTIQVSLSTTHEVECTTSPRRRYGYHDVVDGLRVNNTQVSADGHYAIVSYRNDQKGGRSNGYSEVVDLTTGKAIRRVEYHAISWMPRSTAYLYEDRESGSRLLRRVDARTGSESILARDLPEGSYVVSPTEDYLIITKGEQGPQENANAFQLVEPDDRMTGWRYRTNLLRYDIITSQCQQLTFGSHGVFLQDISSDGRKLLLSVSRSRLTKRPTTVTDFLIADVETMKTDTVLTEQGFLNSAQFSPDGKQLLIIGSPEAFDGIGRDPKAGPYSSIYDIQMFLYDLSERRATAVTKEFNPSMGRAVWSKADGMVYFTADDRDYVHFYRMEPRTLRISQIALREDVVRAFSIANNATMMVYFGVSAMNSVRAYSVNLKNGKERLLADCSEALLKDIDLGECHDFSFRSSRGDTITGRYYLPPHMDPSRKYPMIVNYYGGCSPTTRYFESRYPHVYYASQDYVVLVLNPSGAAGYGQKHSARHVNTAGKGIAEEIVEGVREMCRQHPFVDESRVGCIGASYGGFMTQYLVSMTDIFACAVSHAGISNHTSYWGNGYWGYSYSEVSMAEKYPWNAKDLYTDQSPLFRADKINTPLLLTHGTADTNVPPMESMQLFTALKLLDRDVAFVQFKDENHWIENYEQRRLWTSTIMAWFEKYLKGDDTWWYTLYPKRHL